MVSKFVAWCGYSTWGARLMARRFATAHEQGGSGMKRKMDEKNNWEGRVLGEVYWRYSDADIARKVRSAGRNHKLWYLRRIGGHDGPLDESKLLRT